MNPAVALVDAYLQINGYFTVVEYPVIASTGCGSFEEVTDLDVLAFRFANAGRLLPCPGSSAKPRTISTPDPQLGVDRSNADMLVVEVKEGRAALNPPARRREVWLAALTRFGCCEPDAAEATVNTLVRRGKARTCDGHAVRAIAIGSTIGRVTGADRVIPLAHVVDYLTTHLRRNWRIYRGAQFRHPALGLLMTVHKAVVAGRDLPFGKRGATPEGRQ